MENPHDIDARESVNYLKEYAGDLLERKYDMSKIIYYITLNGYILSDELISETTCKSYDTIHIHIKT
jgi:hypothetical protein